MKKPLGNEPPAPYWKTHIPKYNEHKEWKRDEHGFPIFHDDGRCVTCKGKAVTFSSPWYQFKYQILGYCEKCVIEKMGPAPTKDEEKAYELAEEKKRKPRIIFLWPDTSLIRELEQIAKAS